MGKLVITHRDQLISEVNIKPGDTTIGRKAGNDIVLNDPAVSGTHAVIKRQGPYCTVQDMDSTNGTFVDNKRITRHELRNGETIMIGAHQLQYSSDIKIAPPAKKSESAPPPVNSQERTKILTAFSQLLAIEGKDKGKRLPLIKDEVVIDNPGKSPARIIRTADGYVMHALAGPGEPRLNDKPLQPGGIILEHGDVIEVAGTKYRFFK